MKVEKDSIEKVENLENGITLSFRDSSKKYMINPICVPGFLRLFDIESYLDARGPVLVYYHDVTGTIEAIAPCA